MNKFSRGVLRGCKVWVGILIGLDAKFGFGVLHVGLGVGDKVV